VPLHFIQKIHSLQKVRQCRFNDYTRPSFLEDMALDLLFAIRGLLSFVAFTEFTNAGRCLLPIQYYSDSAINGGVQSSGASYIQARLFNEINLELASERVLSQVYGLYCALNAVVILHVAIFVHHRPIISLGFWVLLLKLLFYVSQAFYFKTITSLPNLMFPLVSCLVSLVATVLIPYALNDGQFFFTSENTSDENSELLRQMRFAKKLKKK